MASPALFLEQQSAARQAQKREIDAQKQQEHRNQIGALYLDAINTPLPKPTNADGTPNPAYQDAINNRQSLMQKYASLTAPEHHASFGEHLHGLIFGQPKTPAQSAPGAQQMQQPAQPGVPQPASEAGPQIPSELPLEGGGFEGMDASGVHPFDASHPVLGKIASVMKALGEHVKAGVSPQTSAAGEITPQLAAAYKSPIDLQREQQQIAAQTALGLEAQKAKHAQELQRIKNQGSTTEKAALNAYALEHGYESYTEMPFDELQTAQKSIATNKRAPRIIQNPETGLYSYANVVDGELQMEPVLDANGKPFGGFRPDQVIVRNGVYHFVGADGQVHEVPVTTSTKKIFGPHAKEDQGVGAPASSVSPTTTPVPTSATSPSAPPEGKGAARRGAAIKAKPVQTSSASAGSPSSTGYAGRTLGMGKLSQQDKGVLESDSQIVDAVNSVLPALEGIKNQNSIMDRAKMELAWQQYQHGMAPSDPKMGEIIRNIALLGAVGAAPWQRIGRNKYTFQVIQQHLPHPTDTPKQMYEKVTWLRDNVVPSSINATLNPAGVTTPVSTKAPKAPGSTQSLADRLNSALQGK